MTAKPTILVTAVGAPPGRNTLRFLNQSGKYRLVASDADKYSPSLYQFAEDGVKNVILPIAADESAYLEKLEEVIATHQVSAIVPCIEEEIVVLARHRERLAEKGIQLMVPEADALENAVNKAYSARIAQEKGIACPTSLTIPTGSSQEVITQQLNTFAETCAFPWIIKPVSGHGMRGVEKVETMEHALKVATGMKSEIFVQECIPGKIGSMHLVALMCNDSGQVVRRFSSRSFCTLFPEGGPATAGITTDNPQLIADTEKLLNELGHWRGPAAVEWMLDPRDGQYKFIEVNARLWGYSSLAAGSGAKFHEYLADLSLGQDIGEDPGFKVGVVMMRATQDLIFETCPFELDR